MTKLLGAALILGGVMVSGVLIWVLNTYRQEGQLADAWLVLFGIILTAVLVLPQLGLGLYLWRGPRPPKNPR